MRRSGLAALLAAGMLAAHVQAEEAAPAAPDETVTLAAEPGDHPEAWVTQMVQLRDGAKIYSTAGGDPVVNGLITYIASWTDPPAGPWRVFLIGDFSSWCVIEDRGDEVVLEVSRSLILDGGARFETATERLLVSTPGDGAETVTVTPLP